MKNIALLVSLAGLIILSTILLLQKPIYISDENQLKSLEENTLVTVQGNISAFEGYGNKYTIHVNNISCIVDSIPHNKNVRVLGIVQKYQGKIHILVLSISNDN